MKLHYLPIAGIIALTVAACTPDRGKALSDYSNPTAGDSLLYYYAQIRADEYWADARTDTSLRSTEERRNYLDGVLAGIKAIRMGEKNSTYNHGVRVGARMAMKIIEIEELYHIDLDDDILIGSFTRGLEDSTNEIPEAECQRQYFRLVGNLKEKHRTDVCKKAQNDLIAVARKENLSKISNNLYYRIEKQGTGPKAKAGDAIFIAVDYRLSDDGDLGMPETERIIIGTNGVPKVLDSAYTRLNKGATAVFATTAQAVFGSRTDIMDLTPDDILLITITLNDIIPPGGQNF